MKRIMMFAVIAIAGLMFMPNVHAISIEGMNNYKGTLEGTTLTLTDNAALDVVVSSGENYVLDLDGHNLENFTNGNATILVENGGTLTIKDSKGTGKITSRSAETSNVSVVVNKGTLTIEDGVTIESTKAGTSAVLNESTGTLTVNGGTIVASGQGASVAAGGSWGLTNEGTATITGGTFIQNYEFSVIQNSGTMTISGGDFELGVGGTHHGLITNNEGNTGSAASLTITGGNFNSENIITNGEGNDVVISGGYFENPEDVAEYLSNGVEFDDEGNVVKVIEADKPAVEEENKANNPETSDINLYALLSLIAISGLGLAYTVKRRYN